MPVSAGLAFTDGPARINSRPPADAPNPDAPSSIRAELTILDAPGSRSRSVLNQLAPGKATARLFLFFACVLCLQVLCLRRSRSHLRCEFGKAPRCQFGHQQVGAQDHDSEKWSPWRSQGRAEISYGSRKVGGWWFGVVGSALGG